MCVFVINFSFLGFVSKPTAKLLLFFDITKFFGKKNA